jgi:hypothetical protein
MTGRVPDGGTLREMLGDRGELDGLGFALEATWRLDEGVDVRTGRDDSAEELAGLLSTGGVALDAPHAATGATTQSAATTRSADRSRGVARRFPNTAERHRSSRLARRRSTARRGARRLIQPR